MKKNGNRYLHRILTAAAAAMTGVAGMTFALPILAEEGAETYEKIMKETAPPGFDPDGPDPYGYDKDEPFYLNKISELMFFDMNGNDDTQITSVDMLKKENTGSVLEPAEGGSTKTYNIDSNTTTGNLNFIQTVAFNPTGSGRKDHIAVLGVRGNKISDCGVFLYVFDREGNLSQELKLGDADWMSRDFTYNNDQIWDFNAMNFLSVTAGDYDGDGRDSLVVYGCYDGTGYGLKEIEVASDSGNISLTDKTGTPTHALLHDSYERHSTALTGEGWVDNMLSAQVKTGDLNGDGTDDLAVLSYTGRLTRDYRDEETDLYRPFLAVSYGKEGNSSDITAGSDMKSTPVWEYENNGYDTMIAPGMDVGQLGEDKVDSIIIAGIHNKVMGESGSEVKDPYDITQSRLVAAVYNGSLDNLVFDKRSWQTNSWTRGGDVYGGIYLADTTAGDQSWQRTGVAAAAMDGPGEPETVFINGDLFKYDSGTKSFRRVNEGEFFKNTDEGAGSVVAAETYIRSIAVGNFDGNPYGNEQIVYVLGMANANYANSAIYTIGMMGAKYKNNETEDPDPEITGYFETFSDALEDTYYPGSGGGQVNIEQGRNYAVCAWDSDDDGLLVRYKEKGFTYSDPEILAVLQAAPYFSEIRDVMFTSGGSTYDITESRSFDTSSGDSISWGAGASVKGETSIGVSLDATLGYQGSWSKTFTEKLTTKENYKFASGSESQVIVTRSPVILYTYEVNTGNGWNEDETMVLSFVDPMVTTLLSVDEYNAFVRYYNDYNKENAEEENKRRAAAGEVLIPDSEVPELDVLLDSYIIQEGNPYGYITDQSSVDDLEILQKAPNAVKVGSSYTSFKWSEEQSESIKTEYSHGLTFKFSIMYGTKTLKGGGYASLSWMSRKGSTKTTATGYGFEGKVSNIDPTKLADRNISIDTANAYTFNYQVVRWPSGIRSTAEGGKDENVVPIYGYRLSNIHTAPPVVPDLKAEFYQDTDNKNKILLSWGAARNDYDRARAYVIYQIQKDGSRTEIAQVDEDTYEYLYDGIDGRNEYVFAVTSKWSEKDTVESVDSNKAYLYTESNALYSIELTASDETSDTYTVTHTNGDTTELKVRHGVGISDVRLTETSEDGLDNTYTIYFTDGTTAAFKVHNGKDAREVELRTESRTDEATGQTLQVIQWRYKTADGEEVNPWQDLTAVSPGEKGADGREIEMQVSDGIVQWRYAGEESWQDLIALADLRGPAGREIEMQVSDSGMVQWKYTDEEEWKDLAASSDSGLIRGEPGREVELQVDRDANEIQWRYTDDEEWTTLVDLSELAGSDGREVEMRYNEDTGTVEWHFAGEEAWQELVSLDPEAFRGDDGREIEMNVNHDARMIQWRYVGETAWTDLVSLDELQGQQGTAGREIELRYNEEAGSVQWRYGGSGEQEAGEWSELFMIPEAQDGRGIVSVEKTSTKGLTDTYTITYTDNTTSSFTVSNGSNGKNGKDGLNGTNGRNGSNGRNGRDFSLFNWWPFSGNEQSETASAPQQSVSAPQQQITVISDAQKEEVSESVRKDVGIDNLSVDEHGNLIITLTDGSTVNSGSVNESTKTDNHHMETSGAVKTYYFNIPYNEFSTVTLDGKEISDEEYAVVGLGDGILVTVSEAAVPSGRLEAVGTRGSDAAMVDSPSGSSSDFPWWLVAWNALLSGGFILNAWQIHKLKKENR